MGDHQSVEGVQWLTYTDRTKNNVTHAGNGREVRFHGAPNFKVAGYCAETGEEYLGCFGMGFRVYPIDMNPLVTPAKHC
jgi:hypothetical protein